MYIGKNLRLLLFNITRSFIIAKPQIGVNGIIKTVICWNIY